MTTKAAPAKSDATKTPEVRPFSSNIDCPPDETDCELGTVLVCRLDNVDHTVENNCLPQGQSPVGPLEVLDFSDCDCLYWACCVPQSSDGS